MTTGTAGSDRLSNDRDVQHELVDALGGNDIVSIAAPNFETATVTVDGGTGSDNLVMHGVTVTGAQVTGAQAGTFSLRNGGGAGSYSVSYSGTETTIVTAVLHGSGRLDGGDSVDIWDLSAGTANSNWSVWTGAATDAVKLSGSFANAVVVTQSGDDSLNLEGVTGGSIGAYGGTGNDSYRIGAHAVEIHEFAGEGTDMVLTARAAYVLPANVETLSAGSNGDKHFTGNEGDNLIQTFGGNDHLFGLGGNDRLLAEGGDDRIDGGEGTDTVEFVGGTYGVVLNLTDRPVPVVGRPDTGRPVRPNEALDASGGIDTLVSIEIYKLTRHADYVYGSLRGERFETLEGNDRIEAGGGDDHIEAHDGNDYIDGGAGADVMIGGAGYDIYVVDDPGDRIEENQNQGPDEVRTAFAAYALAVANVENLTGLLDTGQALDGNDYANVVSGGGGDDVLNGRNGDDTLRGNGGNDILIGLAGFDLLIGGAGDDIYAIDAGDTIVEDFGAGTDEVRTVATIFTLQQNLENLRALSDIPHVFRGNLGPNGVIGGEEGDLFLMQDGGGDVIFGLGGHDRFFFGGDFNPYDFVHGGAGVDTLLLQGNYSGGIPFGDQPAGNLTGIETIRLLSAGDTRHGGQFAGAAAYALVMRDSNAAPGETMLIDASELLAGEWLSLDASAESGNRYVVYGGRGADMIAGGGGGDLIQGFQGADRLTGGGGADEFNYAMLADSNVAGWDTITDFVSGTDRINLAQIDADSYARADQKFTFIGAGAFTNAAGELRVFNLSGDLWRVEGDTDGNGAADLVIDVHVAGGQPLTAGDFIL